MDFANDGPRPGERVAYPPLKAKSRRRQGKAWSACAGRVSSARNDPLPGLDLAYIRWRTAHALARDPQARPGPCTRGGKRSARSASARRSLSAGTIQSSTGLLQVTGGSAASALAAPHRSLEHLSEIEQQRLLRLAVNRLGEKGDWNLENSKVKFEGADLRRCADRGLRLHP